METIGAIVFAIVAIGIFLFFFSFPYSLGLLDRLFRWRWTRAHSTLRGQVGIATSDFTRTLAGTVAFGHVDVAGTIWNAKCRSSDAASISEGDAVEIVSVETRLMWVKKADGGA